MTAPLANWLPGPISSIAMSENETNSNTEKNSASAETPNGHSTQTEDPIQALTAKVKEAEQKYVYLYAEFENYKKRAIKERQDIIKFGWENVAVELLGVLDNLDRALQFANPETTDKNLLTGLQMVAQQFKSTLEKNGVTPVASIDQAFNPEFHEGIGQVASEKPQGTVVQEHLKGYTLHGRLLRPARVMVSQGPSVQ